MCIAAVLGLSAATASPPQRGGGGQGNSVTPIVVSPIPQRHVTPVLGSDGRFHVLYEFLLTNTLADPATLESVQARDAADGSTLDTFGVAELVEGGALKMVDRNPVADTTFPPNESRVLYVTVSFKSEKRIPAELDQAFEVSGVDPFTQVSRRFRYVAGSVELSGRKPPTLAPPLKGGSWLASDGCCLPAGHESAMFGINGRLQAAERWAIDWIKIDPEGRIYTGDPSDPSNWSGYGAKVMAMNDGVIVNAVDDQQDQVPQVKPPSLAFNQLPGNYVSIRQASGLTGVYAHLKPGSVAVEAGDRVKAGEVLGRLGNTGGSLAPHLHYHVVDGRFPARSDGYPYVLRSFDLAATSDVDALGVALQGEAGFPSRDQMTPVEHERELPLGFDIVDFPSGG